MKSITKETSFIDLSENKLGISSCRILNGFLNQKTSKLLNLNLEGNNLGDKAADILFDGLFQN